MKWQIQNSGPYGSLKDTYYVSRLNDEITNPETGDCDEYFGKDGRPRFNCFPDEAVKKSKVWPEYDEIYRRSIVEHPQSAYYYSIVEAIDILEKYGEDYEIL